MKPFRWTRRRGLMTAALGMVLCGVGFLVPAREQRVMRPVTRLDEFAPAFQFSEYHTIGIAAPPDRVFDAIKRVRADEILLFRTLTWIRRGGRSRREDILDPGTQRSILEVATSTGFVKLAEDAPRELVIGTIVAAPPGSKGKLTAEVFRTSLPPGFALAAMNFIVTPEGSGSRVTTETRVYANSDGTRRRFAVYWRVIYPGSAIIRRMWLRAIARRASRPPPP